MREEMNTEITFKGGAQFKYDQLQYSKNKESKGRYQAGTNTERE